jgi:hypothetical protein
MVFPVSIDCASPLVSRSSSTVSGSEPSVKVKFGTMVTVVSEDSYSSFITNVLSDVAERRTDSGEYLSRGQRRGIRIKGKKRRVFVHGDHVCYQNEQFHDSDTEYRLNLAVGAAEEITQKRLERAWGSNTKACVAVAEALLDSACKRLRDRFLRSHADAETLVTADTSRGDSDSELVRLAETIRRQVRRYRRRHPDWRRDFDSQLRLFRATHSPDEEWYREAEEHHTRWLSDFEKRREFEWVEAMRIISLARLYQQRGQFKEGAAIYLKGILIARRARMHEDLRAVVLDWLYLALKACLRQIRFLPEPSYSGPRTV